MNFGSFLVPAHDMHTNLGVIALLCWHNLRRRAIDYSLRLPHRFQRTSCRYCYYLLLLLLLPLLFLLPPLLLAAYSREFDANACTNKHS